jgi:uncharacterized protein YfaS (alpha-2-macroglobulin family)
MKLNSWLAVVMTVSLFLSACTGKRNQLQVTSRNFQTEIEQQQNLNFTFSKDLYPDSLLNRWDSTDYIEFNPDVKGVFKWNSSSELVFSPSEGFKPATEYTAKFTRQLVKHSRKKYSIPSDKIVFHTAPLRVQNMHLSWTRGKSMANVMVQLDLDFNYDVKIEEAAARIKLSSGSNNIISTTVNNGVGKTVSLQFAPLNEKDEETPVNITVSEGIRIAKENVASAKDTTIKAVIPSRYNLTVTDISAQHTGLEGLLTVNTSQPVLEGGLKNMVSIEPSVPFEITMAESGFVINSTGMKADQTYEVTISSQMEGLFGGRMKADHYEQITFGKLDPSIKFSSSKGIYLSSRGYRNLALNIVNVPKVEVTVVKVYENNIGHFLKKDRRWRYEYDEDDDGGGYEEYDTEDMGDVIFSEEYETAKLPKLNSARVLHLDFQDKIKNYNGLYVITVASKEHKWIQEQKILSISDIGLIVKEEKNAMYVFANSIKTASPLSDVKISFVSTNNQEMYTAMTNSEGVAIFNEIDKQAPGFHVGLVTAKMDDEFSFVWLSQSRVETSRFDVGGRVPNASSLNAMIYAERDLYRPGEVIHISTVVRDEQWSNPGEVPVKLRLLMPNGKEFATMRKILNEEGSTETSFSMPPAALTGTYTLEVYTGNDVLLNSYNISVEEFMPDRMKVDLKLDKSEYRIGDSVNTVVQADNLFGTPAANRNYETELNISKVAFEAKNYPDFTFKIENDFNFTPEFRNGKTDEAGTAKPVFGIKSDMKDVGMLKGNVMATVFDETGRPVHRYANFTVYTQPYFAGLKNFDQYVSTRVPMRVGLIALDKNGTPQNGIPLQVTLIKKEWHTVIQQDGNRYKYISRKDEKVIQQSVVKVSGASSQFALTPTLSGEYELRISAQGSNSYVSRTFYAWGYGDTQYSSFEVDNEGNVEIKADKDKYALDEDMDVLFTTPFEGKMLVTVERDRIIKSFYLTTKNKSASVKLPASEACVPNVYITATLFRPMDGSEMPLTVAHGFKNVTVENVKNHIPVQVSLTPKSRSKSKQTITVKTIPNAYVTVAAVDEGILQVKNYETPDPYKYFYQKVALSTGSYDIYPLLLPEVKLSRSSTGGDGADQSQLRVNPTFVNRVKLVSFWSGIVQANSSGIVKYDIDIPQFSGDIRVMAVAYKGKGFGGSDQHMRVADPVVISTALPRFLSPKDEVVMPVTLSNTTAKDASATVELRMSGPLSVNGAASQSVRLPANKEGRVVFHIAAQSAIGAGKVTVVVKSMNETFTDETEIGVRPPTSLQKLFGSGIVNENGSVSFTPQASFIPSTLKGKLTVARSPLVQFTKNLSDLVRYPYGCVEQTTSSVFPQLYYADLVKNITGQESSDANPARNIQQAILKLQSMQLSNGALSYWPDGGSESWWGSVYAMHFLVEARKAGFEVNMRTTDRLLAYLKYKLNRKETEIYYYNGNLSKEIAAKEIAYSLYVLALTGQPEKSTMNYYKAHLDMLSLDSRYLLAAAYMVSGQPVPARQVLPPAFSGEKANQAFGGSFYSYTRDLGISLNALIDIDPNSPQVGIMARMLADELKTDPYLNTQENVWGILAFGKIARSANKTTSSASVSSGSKSLASSSSQPIILDLKAYAGAPLQVQTKGKGPWYYFWETSGITADGSYKQEDSYLRVRRTYYDRSGREVASGSFHQNDLIVVKISLESQHNWTIDNIAITDMLPAGLEIENTRLTEMPDMQWIKDSAEPDYMDIRDDRINFFTSIHTTRKDFYYMVRAVSPGVYQQGPVQADAMYNGAYHSYHGAGVVRIAE